MRRRRKHLEVSTFPFLAVLLCTMGSLILVLLVMDRRAKAAALQKAQAEVARVADEQQRAVEERRAAQRRQHDEALAAWEQRRRAAHERLSADDNELQEQIRLLQLRLAEAAKAVHDGNERLVNLRKQVQAERIRGIEFEEALRHDEDAAAATAAAETEAAKAGVRAAIAEVAKLQSQLEELKAARGRSEHTYSIVPYRGKHGDDRRPLYVECSSSGVTFYPDRAEVSLPLQTAEVRAQVERHAGVRPVADDGRSAYCLLLVRPSGLPAYYEMQVVLHGLQVDFGYEFIDADWLLDFPDDDRSPSHTWKAGGDGSPGLPPTPPLTGPRSVAGVPVAPRTAALPPSPFAGRPGAAPDGPGPGGVESATVGVTGTGRPGSGRVQGYRFGNGETGQQGFAAAGSSEPGFGGPGILPSFPRDPSVGTRGPPGRPGIGNVDGAMTSAAVVGDAGETVASLRGIGQPSGPWTPPGARQSGNGAATAPTNPGAFALGQPGQTGAGQPGTATAAGARGTGDGPPRAPGDQATGTPVNRAGSQTPGSPQGNDTPARTPRDPQGNNAQSPAPGSDTSDRIGPSNGDTQAPRNPNETTGAPPNSPPGANAGSPDGNRSGGTNGAGQPQPPGDPPGMTTPRVPLPTDRFRPPPKPGDDRDLPARRPLRLGDRDWIIYVECQADRVILYPARLEFSLAAVTAAPETNTLLAAVRKMIDRRQAAVAHGDVPYRPEIRFLLRPNSLRTFHATYPALDSVPVPKTRQNLAAEDDVRSVMQ